MAAPVTVYSTRVCPYCVRAKSLLETKHVAYTEIRVDEDPTRLAEMMQKSGRRTVPQIFIGERHVGGFDDLAALDHAGELDKLLSAA
ncbi:MAG: glutaredoxin 3 [Bacillota bacterium]